MHYEITTACVNCGICEAVCPVDAIKEKEGEHRPFVNVDECILCDLCRKECPIPGAIVVKKHAK